MVTRLGRGNGKLGCAIIGSIRLWGCCYKGTLGLGLLTTSGFGVVLSRKLAKILAKGWRPLVSIGFSLEDDSIGKIGLASSNGNSTSPSISSFKLTDSLGRNLPCSSHHLYLRCMQLNWWLVNQVHNFAVCN